MSAEDVKSYEDDDVDGEDNSGKGRKRPASVDEPNLNNDDLRKLENRRAYNRQCAAKARKRSKELVAHLQAQVEDLTKEKAELKRENDVMRAQMELLENQNKALMMNQLVNQQGLSTSLNQAMTPNPQSILSNAALLNATSTANSLLGGGATATSANAASSLLGNSFLQSQAQALPQQSSTPHDLTSLLARLQESSNQQQVQQQAQQQAQQQLHQQLQQHHQQQQAQQQQHQAQQQQQQQASAQDNNSQIAALLGLTSLLSSSAAAMDPNKGQQKL